MKKFRSTLVLMLAILMALGCVGLSANAADVADLEQVELVYWIGGDGEQKDSAEVYAAIDEKLTEQLHATVKWLNIPFSEYYEKWSKAMAAQEQMDLCWTGWMINIEDEVNNGALLPLDDYVEYAPNLMASLPEDAIDMHRSSDGNLYQFPAWQGLVGSRSYFAFPKEKVDLIGDPTWVDTLQELLYENWDKTAEDKRAVYDHIEIYLKALKDNDAMAYGYPAGVNDLSAWYMAKGALFFGANQYAVIDYYDDTFTVRSTFDDERSRINAEYMAKWFEAGYIRQDIASLDANGLVIDWRANEADDTYVMTGHNAFTDNALDKELVGTLFETVAVFSNPDTVFGNGSATGTSIPYTSKNPERAMMLMDLLVTEEGKEVYNLFSFGIEGKHYVWNEDHTMMTTLGGEGQAGANWDYGARPWTLGSLMFAHSTQAYPAPYYQELKAAEETAYVEPLSKFKFDVSPVEIEIANIQAVSQEYGPMFSRGYLGADWEAKYDEFLQKLDAAGMQTYLEEFQRQVTEFVEETGVKW